MSGRPFGYTVTQQTRDKISNARKGIVFSEETKKKMSESASKRVWTKEHREKIKKANTGKIRSSETRRKISNVVKKYFDTKGRKERPRCHHMQDTQYISWRLSVFIRDDYKCIVCGEVGGRLQAHHIEPWSKAINLRYNADNGVTLCKQCHYDAHRIYKVGE